MNSFLKRFTLFAVLAVPAFFSGCATQDEMFVLEDRLAYLEQRHEAAEGRLRAFGARLDVYDDRMAIDDQSLRGRAAAMRVDIDALQAELQGMNGRLEESIHLLKQKVGSVADEDRERQMRLTRLEAMAAENSALIQRVENYLNLEKQAPEEGPPKSGGTEPSARLPEEQLYRSAKQMFDGGAFEASRTGFAELIKRFPKSGNADNAQFWIGESYYREKWYEKAILEYQKVIEKYPKGNKVQASLLKQGFSFFNLGDSANASLILKELIRKYPRSNEAAIARKKLKGK